MTHEELAEDWRLVNIVKRARLDSAVVVREVVEDATHLLTALLTVTASGEGEGQILQNIELLINYSFIQWSVA